MPKSGLDAIDRRIIAELQARGRDDAQAPGAKLLSRPAVLLTEMLGRLQRWGSGGILRYLNTPTYRYAPFFGPLTFWRAP